MSESVSSAKSGTKLTSGKIFLYGIIVKNPVLVQVIGLCPAVAASSSLKTSLLLSLVIIFLLFICEVSASLFLRNISKWIRAAVYMVIGAAAASAVMYFLDAKELTESIGAGIYLPLMAASSVVALRCENFAVRHNFSSSVCDALATGLGTALVLTASGTVRELLGLGTVFGKTVFANAPVPALQMPFGGFIVLGFSAAFLKWFISMFLSGYSNDMSFKIKNSGGRKNAAASVTEKMPEEKSEADKTEENSVSDDKTEPAGENSEKSFAENFYESMSEDIFSDSDFSKEYVEEAEKVIIPVDLDIENESEGAE